MKILAILIIIAFFIIFLFASVLNRIGRFVKRASGYNSKSDTDKTEPPSSKKEFSKDEGEYVNFEEIKEE